MWWLRIILATLLTGLVTPHAQAALITWEFAGTTGGVFPEIPVGTPIHLAWTFDNAEPNVCAGHPQGGGRYFNQSITITIGDSLIYQASGILEAGTRLRGCGGPIIFPEMDLRMFGWSGPNLGEWMLERSSSLPPLMFWGADPPSGEFPSEPPLTTFLLAPRFRLGSELRSVSAQLHFVNAVPEPTTVLLLATGCAGAWIARRRRQPTQVSRSSQ